MSENSIVVSATNETLSVMPRGAFAREFTKAFARLIVARAVEPLDEWVAKAGKLHPEADADKVMELANTMRASAIIEGVTAETAKIMGEENLMYRLAACALKRDIEWAEDNLLPFEASRAVKMAMTVGGMVEYLGESLTLLAATGTSGERRTATPEPTPEQSGVGCLR
jgi:hypothetical protein